MSQKKSVIELLDAHVSFLGQFVQTLKELYQITQQPFIAFTDDQRNQLRMSWISVYGISLSDIIDAIGQLPILSIVPDSEDSETFIKNRQLTQKAVALWLKQLIVNPTCSCELEDRATALSLEYTDSTYAIAIMWVFTLKLAELVYPHSQDLKTFFPSPEVLWGCCIVSANRGSTREAGLTGNPVIRSKTQFLKFTSSSIRHFEDFAICANEQKQLFAEQVGLLDHSEHLFDLLLAEAARLQWENDSIYGQDENFYEKFLALLRQLTNFIKNHDYFQNNYLLPDGKIFTTQRNLKIPKIYRSPKSKSL